MAEMGYEIFDSPIGTIGVKSTDGYISSVMFIDESKSTEEINKTSATSKCVAELQEYFSGNRKAFTVNFRQSGTEFREKVWKELCNIPYGQTIFYKQLAEKIGNIKAIRAVGGANHHNNINIIVPCHRVVGSDGSLTGYGGGLWRKEWLLNHEKTITDI